MDAELGDDLVASAVGLTVAGQLATISGPVSVGDIAPSGQGLEILMTIFMDAGHGWSRR